MRDGLLDSAHAEPAAPSSNQSTQQQQAALIVPSSHAPRCGVPALGHMIAPCPQYLRNTAMRNLTKPAVAAVLST